MIKNIIKSINNYTSPIYIPGKEPNIFLFSTPRSGSTWLMELISSQNSISYCFEPFDFRDHNIQKLLMSIGINNWGELYSESKWDNLVNYKPLINGYLKGRNPHILDLKRTRTNLFNKNYRPISRRLVFKILHAGEHKINWFEKNLGGKIVFLIRHPIPTSLSRKINPRINYFIETDFKNYFSNDIIKEAKRVIHKGSEMQIKVLSWCFQNYLPIRNRKDDWVFLTYEQLILENRKAIGYLANKLKLEQPERMVKRTKVPSMTVSFEGTYSKETSSKEYFSISKWRNHINKELEVELMGILDIFGIDIYKTGKDIAVSEYLI